MMVYLQETLPDWQPMYEHRLPWEACLFLLYLLLVCFFLLMRGMSVIWSLWRIRKTSASDVYQQPETTFMREWELCSIKVASIKRATVLTFILSLLALVNGSIRVLAGASTEKVTAPVFLYGSAAEVLALFALGISVCAALYAAFSLFEGILSRRKVTSIH